MNHHNFRQVLCQPLYADLMDVIESVRGVIKRCVPYSVSLYRNTLDSHELLLTLL